MSPREVTAMLRKREAQGRYVNWGIAAGYPSYYRRRKRSLFYEQGGKPVFRFRDEQAARWIKLEVKRAT
jgi:hypothetical protein